MEVIGSLLTFCGSTWIANIILKNLGVFNLLCVTGDNLLLTFWSLVINLYTRYLIEDNCIKMLVMN
jgi:hypothetical protein